MKRVLFLLMLCDLSYASKLDDIFENIGASVNVTGPGHFQAQSAGHYTGGSLAVRNKIKAVQPFQVNLPKINAGCGGIDAYFGSFSFITGDQLIKLAKRVGSAAPSYAFKLGLKTFAPQIENLFSQLQKWIQDLNNFTLEDCRLVETAFAATLPKGSMMQQHACTDLMRRDGNESDWFGAREKCKVGNIASQKIKEDYSKEKTDTLLGPYNLVKHACQKAGVDASTCEFYMSTVGTVVSTEEKLPAPHKSEQNTTYRIRFYKPLSDNKDQLASYLKGGDHTYYACESEACLNPKEQIRKIPHEAGLEAKVIQRVRGIQENYMKGAAFTSKEQKFLEDVGEKIPLYTYIQISAVQSLHLMSEASEYTALHILLVNLEKIASEVETWIQQLQSVQMDDSVIKEFKDGLQHLKQRLSIEMGLLENKMFAFRTHMMGLENMIMNRKFI